MNQHTIACLVVWCPMPVLRCSPFTKMRCHGLGLCGFQDSEPSKPALLFLFIAYWGLTDKTTVETNWRTQKVQGGERWRMGEKLELE